MNLKYVCKWCGITRVNPIEMFKHEKRCVNRPELKNCYSCMYYGKMSKCLNTDNTKIDRMDPITDQLYKSKTCEFWLHKTLKNYNVIMDKYELEIVKAGNDFRKKYKKLIERERHVPEHRSIMRDLNFKKNSFVDMWKENNDNIKNPNIPTVDTYACLIEEGQLCTDEDTGCNCKEKIANVYYKFATAFKVLCAGIRLSIDIILNNEDNS